MTNWQTLLMQHVEAVLAKDASGHSLDHIHRVVATTQTLLKNTPEADATIATAAAMLHDTYDDKLVADTLAAKQATVAVMDRAGFDEPTQQAILAIIDHMSFKASLAGHQTLSLEGQLVQDADRLDAIGAIGIARAMMYGGAHGAPLYDSKIQPRTELDAASYRQKSPIINHFYEKLLKLAATMNTPAGRTLAAHRQAVMEAYLQEFLAEWNGQS